MAEKYKSDTQYLKEILEELKKLNAPKPEVERAVNISVHPASGLSEEEVKLMVEQQMLYRTTDNS